MTTGPIIRASATEELTRRIPRLRTIPIFYEDWSDTFLNAAKWQYRIAVSSGSITLDRTTPGGAGFPGGLAISSGATNGGAVNLLTQTGIFPVQHGQTANQTIVHKSCVEFDFRFGTITNFGNAGFFTGLLPNTSSTRISNNIMGIGLSSDALTLVSDKDGTETTQATTNTITLTGTTHKGKLTLDRVNGLQLFVDGVLEATITTNIPNAVVMDLGFGAYVINDQAAAAVLYLGRVRSWMEDIA